MEPWRGTAEETAEEESVVVETSSSLISGSECITDD
jgi:hypothetical protein